MENDIYNIKYAGFFTRLAVFLVDLFVLGILLNGVHSVFGGMLGGLISLAMVWLYWSLSLYRWGTTIGGKLLGVKIYDMQMRHLSLFKASMRLIVSVAPFILYRLIREMQYGMVPAPEPIVQMLPQLLYILPPFIMFFTAKRQMLHDLVVGSIVLDVGAKSSDSKEENRPKVRTWGQKLLRIAVILVFLVTFGYVFVYMSVFFMLAQHKSQAYNASFHTHYEVNDYNDTMIRFYHTELDRASRAFVEADGMYPIFEADVKRDLALNCIELGLKTDYNVSEWIDESDNFRKNARNKFANTEEKIAKAKRNEDYMGRHFYDYDLNSVNHIVDSIAGVWSDDKEANQKRCRSLMSVDVIYDTLFMPKYIDNRELELLRYKSDLSTAPSQGTLNKEFYKQAIKTQTEWLEKLYRHYPNLLKIKKQKEAALEKSKQEALKKAKEEEERIKEQIRETYKQDVSRGVPPIFAAIQNHLYDKLQKLIDNGADLKQKNKYGATPLMFAAYQHDNRLLEILLKSGANPNVIDGNGLYTPLSHASMMNDMETARLLLEHGADVNYQYNGSETALTTAAKECKNFEMVKMLLAYGANPNLVDMFGYTTLTGLKRYCRDKEAYQKMKRLIEENTLFE